jgi:glycosyltransferase involved in cell wall biosynthesis
MEQTAIESDLVSVIVPIYNGQKFIETTVRSILAQDYKPVEIIIINDGSTDCSTEIVKSISRELTVLEQTNLGVAYARNKGLALAKGKYVLFLDQDDVIEPTFLSRTVNVLQQSNCIGVVANGYLIDDAGNKIKKIYKSKRTKVDLKEMCVNNQIFTPSQVLLDKNKLVLSGGFDAELAGDDGGAVAEDWELWIRLLKEENILYLNEFLVNYRIHADNSFKYLDKILRSELKIVEHSMAGIGNHNVLKGYRYLFYSYKAAKYNGDWSSGKSALFTALQLNPRFLIHPRLYYYSFYLTLKYCKSAF